MNPKAGLSSFQLSTGDFKLESTPGFMFSIIGFIVDMLPIIVLEPAEPNPELGKLDNGAVKPVLEGCGAPILLAGFPKGMDPEESNVPVGFATDGVANEKEDTALGELLLTNLNKLSDGALDGEGPNVVPTGALVVLAAVVLVAVLPGGGPNLEANVGTDFSENDDAFLEAAR